VKCTLDERAKSAFHKVAASVRNYRTQFAMEKAQKDGNGKNRVQTSIKRYRKRENEFLALLIQGSP